MKNQNNISFVFTLNNGSIILKQIIIYGIVGLPGDVQFEWEDLCTGVVDIPRGFVDVRDPVRVDLISEEITIFVVAVEPQIGWLEVFFVDEFAFDLEISEVIIDATILPGF